EIFIIMTFGRDTKIYCLSGTEDPVRRLCYNLSVHNDFDAEPGPFREGTIDSDPQLDSGSSEVFRVPYYCPGPGISFRCTGLFRKKFPLIFSCSGNGTD